MTSETVGVAPQVLLDNITTVIDDEAVLHRLRLEIPAGKITVLMGPSGGGKTTLIKHLVGLLEPTGGAVLVDGRSLWSSNLKEWDAFYKLLGTMVGGHTLYNAWTFASMTVLQNLMYSLEIFGVPKALREYRALTCLDDLDLILEQDLFPEELPAHGQKRLALARALVLDAPLTVLDEIDVGMDRTHNVAILKAVRAVHERVGATMFITTHDIDVARALADNLAILVHGRIVAVGPPQEVLEGIVTPEDFDRRFEFSDYRGPAQLEEALRLTPRPPKAKPVDWSLVSFEVAAVLVVVVLIILTTGGFFFGTP
jgi:phospholipid/cholesterol/gamma-HCH transport system ATP-binding protein